MFAIISSFQAYVFIQATSTKIPESYFLHLIIAIVSLTLAMNILFIKISYQTEVIKNNLSLLTYILEAILEARNRNNYAILNSLLDTKYCTYVILQMSNFPIKSFNYDHLQKWVKLPEALAYFQKHKFKESDLNNHESMVNYLKTVYPEFLTAYSNR